MPTKDKVTDNQSEKTAKEKSFDYRLQTLTFEMQYIERSIDKMDGITQTIKYWAILIWTGSVGFVLGQQSLRQYAIVISAIPILFWIIDARWRYWLGHLIYRQARISEFINSDALQQAFEKQSFSGFTIFDPMGTVYKKTPEFKKRRNFLRSLKSTEVLLFYAGMLIISISIGIFFI